MTVNPHVNDSISLSSLLLMASVKVYHNQYQKSSYWVFLIFPAFSLAKLEFKKKKKTKSYLRDFAYFLNKFLYVELCKNMHVLGL